MDGWREIILHSLSFPLVGIGVIVKHREEDPDDPALDRHWMKNWIIPVGVLIAASVISGAFSSFVVLSVLESKIAEIVKVNDQQNSEMTRQIDIASHSRERVQDQIHELGRSKNDKK
jgi:hypothetical protein